VSRYVTGRRLFILLVSIILLIAIAGLTLGGQGRKASFPEQVIMDAENGLSGLVYRPLSAVTSFFGGIHNLREMYVENAQLKQEMQNYEALKAKLADLQSQNQNLNTMIGYKQQVKDTMKLVPSHVVGRDPSEWNSELTIDVGTANGVRPEMAVVSEDGSLVGRVATTASHSAKVLLITDTQLGDGVSSLVQNGDAKPPFGIVVGSTHAQGQLEMTFWAPLVHVEEGDTVVTSGLSTIFPPNIVIGTVSSVKAGTPGLAQSAVVKPAADLDYLRNVFVVQATSGAGGK
jgi:rod shape-determining protein MreC